MRVAAVLVALIAGCGSSRSAASAAPVAWTDPVTIASGGGERGPWRQNASRYDHVDDGTVALAADGAAVVAWVDQRAHDVFLQVHEPDGTPRFARPTNVSRSPATFSWLPRLVVDGDQVYALWQEIIFSGGSHGGDLVFARSTDGGRTFGAPVNLSRSVAGDGKGQITSDVWNNGSLDLARAGDGTLFAAWTEYEGRLWVARSGDRGATWTAPSLVAFERARPARAPALAIGDDGIVYLAWTAGDGTRADIHVTASRDRGASFASPTVVARTRGYSDAPKLAVDARGTVHLVYAEGRGGPFDRHDVRYTRATSDLAFAPPRVLSRPAPAGADSAAFPALAVTARGVVHVTWEHYPDHRRPPKGLAIATSLDRGDTWSSPALVPGSVPRAGANGSFQGRLMEKLAADGDAVAIVNSRLALGEGSQVWMIRGHVVRGATAASGP